jgi:type II secretory pathway pseudopilin PulG
MTGLVALLRRRLASEEGWALATAMIVMGMMLSLGLAFVAFSDNQTRSSTRERQRDAAYNYAESLINLQAYALSARWPATAAGAYPNVCNQGNANSNSKCPGPAALSGSYVTADFSTGVTWTTQVRDNGQYAGKSYQSFYSDDILNLAPTWDANGDGEVWVRAQSKLRNKRRTIVARVKVDKHPEILPRASVIANALATGNNGRKTIINTLGLSSQPADVELRGCTAASIINLLLNLLLPNPPCLDLNLGKGQLSPMKLVGGFTGPAVDQAVMGRLKATADALGTHYSTCPASPAGKIIWVDSGNCVYNPGNSGSEVNTATDPGIFVVANGTFELTGNTVYHGIVYTLNQQNSSGRVVYVHGGAVIQGVVYADGSGSVTAGDSGDGGNNLSNITFDERVLSLLYSYLNAGVIQNTFREINGTATA